MVASDSAGVSCLCLLAGWEANWVRWPYDPHFEELCWPAVMYPSASEAALAQEESRLSRSLDYLWSARCHFGSHYEAMELPGF